MTSQAPEQIHRQYLNRFADIDLPDLARRMGVDMDEDSLLLPYYDSIYRVSERGILCPDYREPPPAVKSVLCRYLINFPQTPPQSQEWTAYRDLPNAAPYAGDFRATVEMPLARVFTGKRLELLTSCAAVGGFTPTDGFDYDASMVFPALPHMDVLLLFNDADETFPSKCLLLFEENAHELLDMESLVVVAWRLAWLLFTMSGMDVPEE
ncbi:MAG: DUF3786 domain-containing protein [Desulfatibacillum sp.]|nr:DUF3786 domain-containing protein [Desulfatibacillum sp.]